MSDLSLYLPPFAADYSGACAVLFPLDCMVVILDAGCCMRNYAEYDEPRWTARRKPAFSAQIRTLDTVMGDEQGIVDQVLEAARELAPACIALVGTPVPAVVGMDLAGMAMDIQNASGILCLGIATNGFDTYEHGVSRALRALVEAFAPFDGDPSERAGRSAGRVGSTGRHALRVNLLGVTPLDYPDCSVVEKWACRLGAHGIEVAFDGVAPFGVEDAAALAQADASIVVSWGGMGAARLLHRRFGVPFAVGVPFDELSALELARQMDAMICGAAEAGASHDAVRASGAASCGHPRVLLVGDQVMMDSLRSKLEREEPHLRAGMVAIATFFSSDAALAREGDLAFTEDVQLDAYLREHPGMLVVGDPLLRRLPSLGELIEVIHPAISGQLFSDADGSGNGLLEGIWLNSIVSRVVSLY